MYRQDATLSTSSTFLLHQSAQPGCHDALGNSALLLKSVENVYTKSMSQEESLQKLMREKERADDAQHRQKQENAKLREMGEPPLIEEEAYGECLERVSSLARPPPGWTQSEKQNP